MRQFGKYIVCNVSRLKLVALNEHQAITNINKSLNLETVPLQIFPKVAIEQNRCACCTTQIYKNLHKKMIFCKFIHARKEEFYPTIICIG